jgi:DNA translocase FtsK/SpoIIIE-like protein
MNKLRILLLEDDLETIQQLVLFFKNLESATEISFAVTVLSEYFQVEQYLNPAKENIFDIILMDRDCFNGGSFHCLDLKMYPVDRIIGISSFTQYNDELREKGVKRFAEKDYSNVRTFFKVAEKHIQEIIFDLHLDDQLYSAAIERFKNEKTVSSGSLQQYMKIPYNKARFLLDRMIHDNFCKPQVGARPCDVIGFKN